MRIIWIGAGGAVGSALRYVLAGWVQRGVFAFPVGTLFVNVAGCFAIGFLSTRFETAIVDPHLRSAILVGTLGGFTTFSTFSLETLRLVDERQFLLAGLNAVGTLVACLLAVWAGRILARGMVG